MPGNAGATPTRVFVVEDSPAICERIVEDISGLKNVEIVGTANREGQAISAIQKTPADIAFVDINLLEGNGLNVTREIRKIRSKVKLRIVIMTSFASPVLRKKSLALGADDFLDKLTEFRRIREIVIAMGRPAPEKYVAH